MIEQYTNHIKILKLMKKNTFDYTDYKAYLNDRIASMPGKGRGERAKLADAIGCQRAFVSHVLQGDAHFNLEHGDRLNRFLNHSWDESQFFLLLIQLARAGTKSLEEHHRRQLHEILERRLNLKKRLGEGNRGLGIEESHQYYSSWIYGAIRIATSIPQLRTKEAISKRLGIEIDKLTKALEFLLSCGLVEQKGNEFLSGPVHTHLGNDSALITKHHTNWRVRALSSFDREGERDIHFSSVYSLSKNDALKIKAQIVAQLEQINATIQDSPEETLISFCLDWYEL